MVKDGKAEIRSHAPTTAIADIVQTALPYIITQDNINAYTLEYYHITTLPHCS